MKNKHNTMNAASSQKTYMKMQSKLLEDAQNRCFLVEVIAKKSQNISWEISLDGQKHKHDFIRRISIDKFYGIVTGDPNAFKTLCEILPKVLDDVIGSMQETLIQNTVLSELQQNEDILRTLYLMSFQTYEGFETFAFR